MVERDFLISALAECREKFGKIPSQKDLKAYKGHPSIKRYIKEFGSWQNAIDETFGVKEVDKDGLSKALLKYKEEYGKIPTYTEIRENPNYPSTWYFEKEYGSWNNAINEIFYDGKRDEAEKEYLIAEVKRFKDENGRIPRSRDMREYNGYPSDVRYVKAFGKWDNAIQTIFYNKETMSEYLLQFEAEHGRVPSYPEIRYENGYIAGHRYKKIFGSWSNAIRGTPFMTRIDEHFFSPENMNPRKWYIVSYIIGDGCVKDCQLHITTTEKDKDNLYDMHQYMNLDTNVEVKSIDNCQDSYKILKQCKQWVDDLALYGVVPRKSLISYIPLDYLKTPEDEAAVMRGIFDSDGGIHYRTCRKYPLVKCGKSSSFDSGDFLPVFFICGSEQLCEDYRYLIKKNCDVDCEVLKHHNIYRIQVYGKEKCQQIYDFIYGHDNFYIKRKKERFEKLLNGTFTLEDDNY